MPTYVYKFIDTGETIEVQQAFTDDTLTQYAHPTSGDVMAVKKVFQPVGVTFKGSGFFKNDNREKKNTTKSSADSDSRSSESSSSTESSGSKGSNGESSSPSKKAETGSDSSSSSSSSKSSGSSSSSSNASKAG